MSFFSGVANFFKKARITVSKDENGRLKNWRVYWTFSLDKKKETKKDGEATDKH